jgi:hypothetical protein
LKLFAVKDRAMAQEHDKGKTDGADRQTIAGQQSHRSEYGAQGLESDGMSGQPIGGNDSNTGSGTTLTQGADFSEDAAGSGFILRNEDESEREGASSSKATGGKDFADQGRGAAEKNRED